MDIKISPAELSGTVRAPVSKSFVHRCLICAALSGGTSRIRTDLSADDLKATADCISAMGAGVSFTDGVVTVTPPDGFRSPAVLDCGESGSTLRFLLPVCGALGIESTFLRKPGLAGRPVSGLVSELCRHGLSAEENPLKIKGRLSGGEFILSGEISSQGISGVLMALPLIGGRVTVTGKAVSGDYTSLTVGVMKLFGVSVTQTENCFPVFRQQYKPVSLDAEGDWSGAAFFLAAGAAVTGLSTASLQGDRRITEILSFAGARDLSSGEALCFDTSHLHGLNLDAAENPDLVPVVAALGATAEGTTVITNTGRLRYKESNRIKALLSLLRNVGADADFRDGSIIINGKPGLCGGTADSFGDHRIVMAAALLSSRCRNGIIIKNAGAVSKSYPGFFNDFTSVGGKINVL